MDDMLCNEQLSVVVGDLATVASRQQSMDTELNKDKDSSDESLTQNGRLSVFVHKREDQPFQEVIQMLLRYPSHHIAAVESSSFYAADHVI